MFTKRSWIALLVGVNAMLIVALLAQVVSLPTALAQASRRGGKPVCVTAKGSGQTYDVLYVLDPSQAELLALYPGGGPGSKLKATPPRDLKKDFER